MLIVALMTLGGVARAAAPTIDHFTPTGGAVGAAVYIFGTNLTGATHLDFNGTTSTIIVNNEGTAIATSVPTGATSGPIVVSTPDGTVSSSTNFTVTTPSETNPVISSFTPTSGPVNTYVTITGVRLTGTTSVKIGSTLCPNFNVNAEGTQITTAVPTGATTGTIYVLTNHGNAASGTQFQVTTPSETNPVISSFTPTSGPVNTYVTITGLRLTGVTAVQFGSVSAPFSPNAEGTQIITKVPTGAVTATIYVLTNHGNAASPTQFQVTTPTETNPVIQSFTPASGPVGARVYITGVRLAGATAVKFNGVLAAWTTNTEGTLIATNVPAGATTGRITVTTPGGTATSATDFVVTTPTETNPVISSFTPTSGPVGTTVTITGLRLAGAAVKFGDTVATNVTVNAEGTRITVVVPTGAVTGLIRVHTSGGDAASTTNFTVTTNNETNPVINGFTPASGPIGAPVVITGVRLTGVTAVQFGSVAAATFTTNAEGTRIETVVPQGATTATIYVLTNHGNAASATQFQVTAPPAPTIITFSPISGPVGALVVVSGTNFYGVTAVKFNGVSAPFTVNSAAQLTAKVPAGAITGPISVTTSAGTVTTTAVFTVLPTPGVRITGFYPAAGNTGINVAIYGSNFTGATAVRFGGVAATSFTVNSDRQITAIVPPTALSGSIAVATPNGAGETPPALKFTVIPRIVGLAPTSGPVGTLVTINGANFYGATLVKFGSLGAAFTVVSPTQIIAEVPQGATSGAVVVGNPGGAVTSSTSFTVAP